MVFSRLLIILLIASLFSSVVLAQEQQELKGFVIDALTGDAVEMVTVFNVNANTGVVGNSVGRFNLDVLSGDSVAISILNYLTFSFVVADSMLYSDALFVVNMKKKHVLLDEFNVRANERVPVPLRSDVFREKPVVIDYFFHPFSVLYYYVSRRERHKREMLHLIDQEKLMNHYTDIYNVEMIKEYSGFEGRELDFCIIYCNSHINLEWGDSEAAVKQKLFDTLTVYFKNKALKK